MIEGVPVKQTDEVECPHCGRVAVVSELRYVEADYPGFVGTGHYYCVCSSQKAVVYDRGNGQLILSFPPVPDETQV